MEPGSVGETSGSAQNQPPTDPAPVPWRSARRLARKPRVKLPYSDLVKPRRPATNTLSVRQWYPGATCHICGTPIHSWQKFNWDHVEPMSRGGARGRKNKKLTHMLCNSVKGDSFPFSLRTTADRYTVSQRVSPATYARLQAVWRGEPG